MTKGAIASIASGILTLAVMVVSAGVFLMFLIIGLNGFGGQEHAVNGAFITFLVLAVVTGLLATGLGAWLAFYLTERRKVHAAGSAALAIVSMSVAGGVLHMAAVIIAGIVADQLRR
jgi:hypothetical protein